VSKSFGNRMEFVRPGAQRKIVDHLPAFGERALVGLFQPIVHSLAPIKHLLLGRPIVDHDAVHRQIGAEVAVSAQFKYSSSDDCLFQACHTLRSNSPGKQFLTPACCIFRNENSSVVPDSYTQVWRGRFYVMPTVLIPPNRQKRTVIRCNIIATFGVFYRLARGLAFLFRRNGIGCTAATNERNSENRKLNSPHGLARRCRGVEVNTPTAYRHLPLE
jgi:hypothetical protein